MALLDRVYENVFVLKLKIRSSSQMSNVTIFDIDYSGKLLFPLRFLTLTNSSKYNDSPSDIKTVKYPLI